VAIFINVHIIVAQALSVGSDGSRGNGDSANPALSNDGRFVALASLATNLVSGDRNSSRDVFVYDRTERVMRRIPVPDGSESGLEPDGDSMTTAAAISADGRFVAFESLARNLVPADTNETRDVFVARMPTGPSWLVAAPAAARPNSPGIQGFSAFGSPTLLARNPYPGFNGPIRVAYADVTGDGAPDLITGAGPPGGPHVKVFKGSTAGVELVSFFAYAPTFLGGVFVAACDLDGDGTAELVTGAGAGGGPHVRVFKIRLTSGGWEPIAILEFFSYDPGFRGGVRVACGDVDGSGKAAIVTGAGSGGGPHVRVFKLTGTGLPGEPFALKELASFMAYDLAFLGGVSVAVGDLEGTGRGLVITSAGPGGGSHVRAWDVSGGSVVPVTSFFAYEGFTGGVNVAAGDTTGDGRAQIVTGPGPGLVSHVRTFSLRTDTLGLQPEVIAEKSFVAFDPAFGLVGAEVTAPNSEGHRDGGGGL